MSILVKGMEMPKSCYSCLLKRRNGMDIVCPVTQEMFSVADVNILFYRLDSCPLIEVPEPHGRLIDADALCASHKEVCSRSMKFNLDLAQTVIPASESKERPAFLPTYELTPRKTNADRIRAMSDEELADLLVSTDGDFPPNCEDVPVRKLEAYWLDWLKQEAE